ncbi:MAG: hypothetical protein WCW13_04625 [archaeon]|jgi:hypothetical protein
MRIAFRVLFLLIIVLFVLSEVVFSQAICDVAVNNVKSFDSNCEDYGDGCRLVGLQNHLDCATFCSLDYWDVNNAFNCYSLARRDLINPVISDLTLNTVFSKNRQTLIYEIDTNFDILFNQISTRINSRYFFDSNFLGEIFVISKLNLFESSSKIGREIVSAHFDSKVSLNGNLNSADYLNALSKLEQSIGLYDLVGVSERKYYLINQENKILLALVLEKYYQHALIEYRGEVTDVTLKAMGKVIEINFWLFVVLFCIIVVFVSIYIFTKLNAEKIPFVIDEFSLSKIFDLSFFKAGFCSKLLEFVAIIWTGTTIGFTLVSSNVSTVLQALSINESNGIVYLVSSESYRTLIVMSDHFTVIWGTLTPALIFSIFAVIAEKIYKEKIVKIIFLLPVFVYLVNFVMILFFIVPVEVAVYIFLLAFGVFSVFIGLLIGYGAKYLLFKKISIVQALNENLNYYPNLKNLFGNITELFPKLSKSVYLQNKDFDKELTFYGLLALPDRNEIEYAKIKKALADAKSEGKKDKNLLYLIGLNSLLNQWDFKKETLKKLDFLCGELLPIYGKEALVNGIKNDLFSFKSELEFASYFRSKGYKLTAEPITKQRKSFDLLINKKQGTYFVEVITPRLKSELQTKETGAFSTTSELEFNFAHEVEQHQIIDSENDVIFAVDGGLAGIDEIQMSFLVDKIKNEDYFNKIHAIYLKKADKITLVYSKK